MLMPWKNGIEKDCFPGSLFKTVCVLKGAFSRQAMVCGLRIPVVVREGFSALPARGAAFSGW